MRPIFLLFLSFLILIVNVDSQYSVFPRINVDFQFRAISHAARTPKYIELLNELIEDSRKFDRNNQVIVQRTMETLGKAKFEVAGVEYFNNKMNINASVVIRIGNSKEKDRILMRRDDSSSTKWKIYAIEWNKNAVVYFNSKSRMPKRCDLLCMFGYIFSWI